MTRSPVLIPALIGFPGASARQDAWGRLLELTPAGAILCTAAPLAPGEELFLSFGLGDEELRGVSARAAHVERDADGQLLIELRFTDELERRRLSRVLLDVLSRTVDGRVW